MSSAGSKGGSAPRRRKFRVVGQISRGNRRGESFWRYSPVKKSTARAAKTDCRESESFNCRLPIDARIELRWHHIFFGELCAKAPSHQAIHPAVSPTRKCRLAAASVASFRSSKASQYRFRRGGFFHKADPQKRFGISRHSIVDVENQRHSGTERALLTSFWRDSSRLLLPIGGHFQQILRRPPLGSALRSQARRYPRTNR